MFPTPSSCCRATGPRRRGWAAVALCALLAACAMPGTPPLKRSILDERQQADAALEQAAVAEQDSRALVQAHTAPYLPERRVPHTGISWLNQRVRLRAAGLPFDLCLAKALAQLPNPPSVVFTPDLSNRHAPVTLDHQGSFMDFLNLLAEASGYAWEERSGALRWMAEITRTYEIHRVPGEFDYSMETSESSGDEAVQSRSGGGGNVLEVQASPESGGQLQLSGGGQFWDDLEQVLMSLMQAGAAPREARPPEALPENDAQPLEQLLNGAALPPESLPLAPEPIAEAAEQQQTSGVFIDRSTSTVVLSGRADAVRRAGDYVEALNRWLSRQVLLQIQLVSVSLNSNRQLGIDWNLVRKTATSMLSGGANLGASTVAAGAPSLQVNVEEAEAMYSGSNVIIRALQGQGNTTVRQSPRIVALNGQAAQLKVLSDRGYLAGIEVTTVAGLTGSTETELSPGVISTGIALTILPKIVGDRVFLQASISVSDLVNLVREGPGTEKIQLPTVNRNQFFQSARLQSGETLALGGLVTRRSSSTHKHLPVLTPVGGADENYSSIESVLLITPTLLDPPAPDEILLR